MREYFPMFIAQAARIAVAVGVLTLSAGCSSEITRLSQPFFSDPEVTGSVTPIPRENVAPPVASTTLPATAVNAPSTVNPSAVESRNIPRTAGDGFFVVRAESGDSAYSLSRRYGISVRAIMAANRMSRPEDLRPGQNILIPPISWRPQSAVTLGAAKQPDREAKRIHIVGAGETLSAIARDNGLSATDLARHNRIEMGDRLNVGQRLELPSVALTRVAKASNFANDAGGPVPPARPRREARAQTRQAASLKPLPAPNTRNEIAPLPSPRPSVSPERTVALLPQEPGKANSGPLPEPQAMSVGKFRWPVRGRVISRFGSRPNGVQNDGINVAVPEGASVKAAENGVVAYVGNELKGYGNLILIRHADDWVSAYAHNSQTLVTRGEQVRRGQIIAKAGQSGNVARPQLHFELRKGSRPVDPIGYLDASS